MSDDEDREVEAALSVLRKSGVRIPRAGDLVPDSPGLYAVHGEAATWAVLGLGHNPDGRPLYVGKSESSLLQRDLRQHFADGRTGSSTLRRSFAALLRERLDLHAIPRNPSKPAYFANFGLAVKDDEKLTGWMVDNLSIATWIATGSLPLGVLEGRVIAILLPPLNLTGVVTQWSASVKTARAKMATEARKWRSSAC